MSDCSRINRVTVTLGRDGRVVKRAGGFTDEGISNGVPIAGSKRSVRDRLGGRSEDRSESYDKRQRGESTSNSIGKDDLRFKLMQKNMSHESLNSEPLRNFDLRDKLSSMTPRPSADRVTMRPPESAAIMRPFVLDPRIAGMTRHPVPDRDMSILGRFPPLRNPSELAAIGAPRKYSSWTLENLRRRSPENLRRRSPENMRRISPDASRRICTEGLRRRSPEDLRRRSPEGLRRISPKGLRRISPGGLRPGDFRLRSPEGLRRISPSLRRISPERLRRRSPGDLRLRSPEVLRRQSPGNLRRRSPEGLRRISPEGWSRRSPQDLRQSFPEGLRRRSPGFLRRRSPEGLRRRSPESLRRRSPERLFRPSAARGRSPQRSGDDLQRRPLVRPYDDARSTAYVRVSPRRAMRSPPYLTQSSVPARPIKSVVPVSRYPQASGVMQRIPSAGDVPHTVDSFLQSLGLEKYAILFKAEEIDMNALRQLGDGDLKALGIPMGPRKAIVQAVMSRARRQL